MFHPQSRQFHLLRRDRLDTRSVKLARIQGLHQAAQRLLIHLKFARDHPKTLACLHTLYRQFSELRCVCLLRYLQLRFSVQVCGALYPSPWKTNFREKLNIARGELMRYFAEMVWYPTALLPSQGVSWTAVDAHPATATLVNGPISLTLLFQFDEAGLVASVHADARGAGVGKDMVMLPWDCRVSNYQLRNGMMVPTHGEAAWLKPQGRQAYFIGELTSMAYEFSP